MKYYGGSKLIRRSIFNTPGSFRYVLFLSVSYAGDEIHSFTPLGGAGARPAPGAGPILELLLEKQALGP